MKLHFSIFLWLLPLALPSARAETIEVDSLDALARAAAGSDQVVKLKPGVYRMADYLTEEVLAEIRAGVDRRHRRPPVPMFIFRGDRNRFDLTGAVIEIETRLYAKLPQGGYTRCLIVEGSGNRIEGLSIRNTGPGDRGSGGNILSIAGDDNVLENISLHVHGSFPYGYGDLLGKGGPNLVTLQKQSGIQVLGSRTVLRRCRVISRAFGHCFYIQAGEDIVLEDCYAEGVVRTTNDMLGDATGPAFDLGFRSVYENREGRHLIVSGYTKSLVEDGFRTYGGAGNVILRNCTAINTRAGFEIGTRDDSPKKTIIEGASALGCERAFLIGSHTIVRNSRGDTAHGPLLYLRGGRDSDVELELAGEGPRSTVHVLATIAGSGHRVRLTGGGHETRVHALPIMVGFGMPDHAEMASPIRPAAAKGISLSNEISASPVIVSGQTEDLSIETTGRTFTDERLRASPGSWN